MLHKLLNQPFVILVLCIPLNIFCQQINPVATQRLGKIRALYQDSLKKGNYVTPYILDSLVEELQSKVSGTVMKDGKIVSTTASIEDKSITVNHIFASVFERKLFLLGSLGGTSDEDFVDIFSGGKYKRTISGGLTFNFFPALNSGSYLTSQKYKLWRQLQSQDVFRTKQANN